MIFLGAALGGLVSQGTVSTKLIKNKGFKDTADGFLKATTALWPFKRFRNKKDQARSLLNE